MASAPYSEQSAQNDNNHSGLDNHFDRLSITSEDSSSKGLDQEISSHDENCLRKWGLRLKDLYRLALRFYREKEGKAVQFSYEDKLRLVALAKQVSVGRFTSHSYPPLGVLDVIGRDRRLAWQALGEMSREDAMTELVELLDSKCHLFRPHIEAHKADIENRKRIREEEEERGRRALEEERVRNGEGPPEEARRRVQEALNAQTLAQFTRYAREQAPDDPQKQGELVRRLQEEHYLRYMEEVTRAPGPPSPPYDAPPDSDPDDPAGGSGCVMPVASMWTRKDVKEFKESIRREGGDAVIRVGHGETVTVRVPTNDEGTCLFWEFATDHYDIGFGVYFEWSKSPTSQVSVHVSESEDDDDYLNEDDDDDEEYGSVGAGGGLGGGGRDLEAGGGLAAPRSALSVIVPVYRRDCQDEVFAGSHAYPGQGVYLLKFDNSYSLWRSKTLYYRVYYTR